MQRAIAVLSLLALPAHPALAAAQSLGTFRYDPVELVKGNRLQGDETIFADHYLFRYLFATPANKAEFEKNPARYEIQMGGGCGRMGPLSGVGRTDLFAVHDGRIYIFASDSCRDMFIKHADKLIETPDSKPQTSPDGVRKANELLDKAAEAMGGAAKIDAVRSYRQRVEGQVEYQGQMHDQAETVTIGFPDRIHHEHAWDESRYTSVAVGGRGWFTALDKVRPMHAQQLAAMTRTHPMRNPLAILKLRGRPGFVAAANGADKLELDGKTIAVEKVTVWCDGAAAELWIGPDTGRIHAIAYRGRGPKMMIGQARRVFTEFREVDGLTLPAASKLIFDGEPVEDSEVAFTSLSIDKADAAIFEAPADLPNSGG